MRGLTTEERAALDPTVDAVIGEHDPVWARLETRGLIAGFCDPIPSPTLPGHEMLLVVPSALGWIALRADAAARMGMVVA